MYFSRLPAPAQPGVERRTFQRLPVQCRARIRIGTRQYAGYVQNVSRGGARLRTITPIRKLDTVTLRLPDLPPLRCRLCWNDSYNAGVMFELPLPAADFQAWAKSRAGVQKRICEFAELTELIG